MEKSLCNIEILKSPDSYIAKIQTDLAGIRVLRSSTFEGILEQVMLDIQEEFEIALWLRHFSILYDVILKNSDSLTEYQFNWYGYIRKKIAQEGFVLPDPENKKKRGNLYLNSLIFWE